MNETTYIRNKDVLFNKIDDEIVMLKPDESKYLGLNETASFILEKLEKEYSLENLIVEIKKYYNLTEDEIQDVKDTLDRLVKERVVTVNHSSL